MSTLHKINPENWSMRSPAFIACASVVGIMLILLVFVLVLGGRDGETAPGPAAAPACEAPAAAETDIYGTPEHSWTYTGSVLVPASESAGPSVEGPDTNSCYARSPEGAVFAAMNLVAMDMDGQSRDLYENRTVDGPARDAALEQVQANVAPTPVTFRGFALVDYSTEAATVELVLEEDGFLGAVTVEVAWEDGDWKLDPPTSLQPPVKALTSMTGYHSLTPPQEG